MSSPKNESGPGFLENGRSADCAAIAARLSTRGPDGRLQSVITGQESDAELRGIVIWFIENCSASRENSQCPFSILKNAYHGSISVLMEGMTRAAVLSLIEMEVEARNNQPALCGQPGEPGPAVHSECHLTKGKMV